MSSPSLPNGGRDGRTLSVRPRGLDRGEAARRLVFQPIAKPPQPGRVQRSVPLRVQRDADDRSCSSERNPGKTSGANGGGIALSASARPHLRGWGFFFETGQRRATGTALPSELPFSSVRSTRAAIRRSGYSARESSGIGDARHIWGADKRN